MAHLSSIQREDSIVDDACVGSPSSRSNHLRCIVWMVLIVMDFLFIPQHMLSVIDV